MDPQTRSHPSTTLPAERRGRTHEREPFPLRRFPSSDERGFGRETPQLLRRDPNDPSVADSATLEVRGLLGSNAELRAVQQWASDPAWLAALEADGADYPIRDIRARTLRGRDHLIYVEFVSHFAAENFYGDLVDFVSNLVPEGSVSWTSTRPGDRVYRRPFSRRPSPDYSDEPEPGWSHMRRSRSCPRFTRGFEARRADFIDFQDPVIAQTLQRLLSDAAEVFDRLRTPGCTVRPNAPFVAMARLLLLPEHELLPHWFQSE